MLGFQHRPGVFLGSHNTDCRFNRLLPQPGLAPQDASITSSLHPLPPLDTQLSPGNSRLTAGPSPRQLPAFQSPCASTSHARSPGLHPPCPPSGGQAEGAAEESRGESLSIPFIPPQSGLHPLPGAKIQRYIQPAAATGHVSPLLGYRDPKINPSQPD